MVYNRSLYSIQALVCDVLSRGDMTIVAIGQPWRSSCEGGDDLVSGHGYAPAYVFRGGPTSTSRDSIRPYTANAFLLHPGLSSVARVVGVSLSNPNIRAWGHHHALMISRLFS